MGKEGKKDGAAALIRLFTIWPSSLFLPPSVLFHTVYLIGSAFSQSFLFLVLLMLDRQICLGGMKGLWRVHEKRWGGGEGKERQKANEAVLFGKQHRFFRFRFNMATAK